MKTLEDYIKEYDLEQLYIPNHYSFKNPCHYPICGNLFAYSKIKPFNVYDATTIFATENCIEYAGWNRIYPEEYEQYFIQMQQEYNMAIARYITYKIEKKLSNIEKDF